MPRKMFSDHKMEPKQQKIKPGLFLHLGGTNEWLPCIKDTFLTFAHLSTKMMTVDIYHGGLFSLNLARPYV